MILFLLILLFLLLLPVLCFPSCPHPEQKVDCLIVLGCPTYANGQMSTTQKQRVEKAVQVVNDYSIPLVIFTGGKAHNQFSEAHVMAAYFKSMSGIDAFCEDQSTTTFENMKNCQQLCQKKHIKKIGILTSSYHANRAYAMSHKFFDDIVMFRAPYRITLKKLIREYISRVQYLFIEFTHIFK